MVMDVLLSQERAQEGYDKANRNFPIIIARQLEGNLSRRMLDKAK